MGLTSFCNVELEKVSLCNISRAGDCNERRPRALDLFCGAGGASSGLYQAGFDVVGIDIKPQKNYPFKFIQADALCPPVDISSFDFVWASPPCQLYSVCNNIHKRDYPDLIEPVRNLLLESGLSFIIENVPGAPLRDYVTLSGPMFNLPLIRRRNFESNMNLYAPLPPRSRGSVRFGNFVTVAGGGGGEKGSFQEWKEAMQIDWMTREEITQAIPPVYSLFLGKQVVRQAMEQLL